MDYCDSGSLDKFVKDTASTYTLIDVLNWAYQLADALNFLHSKKIMHRDVKLQNILLKDNYQTLVLTDYGTATDLGRSLLTQEVGTPMIMAPEVISGTNYTEQCDIFSWAIVFWQLISKQFSPYGILEKSPCGLVWKVVTEKLRPYRLNHCPDLLVALLYRSWHSDPNERPTLFSIKRILRLILNTLPKSKTCSEAIADEVKKQCTNESNSLEKYFPYEPRLHNEKSKNIYDEHLKKLKSISNITQEISKLEQKVEEHSKQNQSKRDQYMELLEENKRLEEEINKFRSKELH